MPRFLKRLGRWTPAPLAVLLLLLPSVEYQVKLVDWDTIEFYGAPLPWNSRGLTASMTKDVYLIPLLVDVAAYGLLAWLLVWLWGRRPVLRAPAVDPLAAVAVWLAGAAVLGLAVLYLIAFWRDLSYAPWYSDGVEAVTGAEFSTAF